MKNIFMVLLILLAAAAAGYSQAPGKSKKESALESPRQQVSYSVGYRLGLRLKSLVQDNDIDLDTAIQGIKDAASARPQMPESEMVKIYGRFNKEMERRRQERQKILAYKNKTGGEKFLKENAGREGIVVTESGLQYEVLREGDGPIPKETDIAILHYRGSLIEGKEVFNTYKLGHPVKLPVKRSLPAWNEGLRLMKVGSKYRFFIPPALAYKEFGKSPSIGPHAVLIYEAELLGIE